MCCLLRSRGAVARVVEATCRKGSSKRYKAAYGTRGTREVLDWVIGSELVCRRYRRDRNHAECGAVLVGKLDASTLRCLQLGHDLTGKPAGLHAGRCHVGQLCTLLIHLEQVTVPEVEVVSRHQDRGSDGRWLSADVPVPDDRVLGEREGLTERGASRTLRSVPPLTCASD